MVKFSPTIVDQIKPVVTHRSIFALCCSMLFLFPKAAMAQPDIIETGFYSVNDGLSDRLIKDILQSSNGFLWLATPTGLNKFDGYEFTIFNDHPNNPNQISGADIKRIEEVENGNILILFENNLVFFDILNLGSLESHRLSLLPEDGIRGIVRDIQINPDKQVQVLTQTDSTYNLYQLSDNRAFNLHLQIPMKFNRRIISTNFIQLYNGHYLINDNANGLKWFDETGTLVKHIRGRDFICRYCPLNYPNKSNFLHQSKDSTIWIAYSKIPGVFQLDQENKNLVQFTGVPTRKTYFKIWEDEQNNIMVEQGRGYGRPPKANGIFYINADREVIDYDFILQERNIISDIYSKNFAKNIFVGHDTGFRILQNNQSKVQSLLSEDIEFDERGITIEGITGDGQGSVFFADSRGFWHTIDLQTDQMSALEVTNEKTGRAMKPTFPKDFQYERDSSILWATSNAFNRLGRLTRIDIEECTARSYVYKDNIKNFVKSTDGSIWLICENNKSQGKIVVFDPETEEFSTFMDSEGINPLENTIPHCILESADGLLWIGTEKGLFAIDRDQLSFKRYTRSYNKNNPGLTSNSIYIIHEDSMGRLWLGTNNGLNILNPATDEIETYDQSHGLASNTVCGILPDEEGNYWISTFNGLSYFDYDNRLFRNFYQLDGLSHDEFSRGSYYRDENGRYYFGGVNGLNAFYPKDLLETNDAPKIVLTKFVKFDSRSEEPEILSHNLDQLREVTISPYNTYFQFHFILPNFTNSIKNQFSVWLENFDKDWVYLGNNPTIRYNSLPPGKYILHIDGAGPNGNWSGDSLGIKINVKPIFYKTWWFILLVMLFTCALIYGIFQYQLDQRLKVQRIRMKLSSDLHDEMSGLLSGIAMQSDILQMMTSDNESKSRLKIIGEVSRRAMSKMSDVIWSIDSRKDRVQDLIQRMHEHADEILLPLDIKYDFTVFKIDENQKMPVTIRQNLYFIYKEAINNIAKHSQANRVNILFGNKGNDFEMAIQDNGKGPDETIQSKTGQGISNLKMRAKRINAQLDIATKNGVTVKLNMGRFA